MILQSLKKKNKKNKKKKNKTKKKKKKKKKKKIKEGTNIIQFELNSQISKFYDIIEVRESVIRNYYNIIVFFFLLILILLKYIFKYNFIGTKF